MPGPAGSAPVLPGPAGAHSPGSPVAPYVPQPTFPAGTSAGSNRRGPGIFIAAGVIVALLTLGGVLMVLSGDGEVAAVTEPTDEPDSIDPVVSLTPIEELQNQVTVLDQEIGDLKRENSKLETEERQLNQQINSYVDFQPGSPRSGR